jgi:peptidoglycan/LPS O-acetylase OafA/YrhL
MVESPSRTNRFAALDGMRGLAVASVMAFHTGVGWASGGSVGVDVFFVLSGFLITLLLLQEWSKNSRIALGRFYVRRLLRLYPALLVMAAAVLIYGQLAVHPVGTKPFDVVILGPLLYITDFQGAAGHIPFLSLTEHTWSLAVEEQFYLIWPPLLALMLARRATLRVVLAVILLLTAASAVLPTLLWSGPATLGRIYESPDTRGQALLLGCALAVVTHAGWLPSGRRAAPVSQVVGLAGAAGLVFYTATGSYRDAWNYTDFGLTLVALCTVAVIASTLVLPTGPIARVLAFRPLVGVGRISYGLYLWHWPIFIVLNQGYLGRSFLVTQLIRVAVTLVIALLSYHFVEQPCLRLRHRFDPPTRVPAPAATEPAAHPV